jgi:hypothetical protein
VLADAPDAGHLLLVEGPGLQGLEIVLHLRCCGGGRETDVHIGMGENEAVATGSPRPVSFGTLVAGQIYYLSPDRSAENLRK